jgi:hypothetical protein
VPIRNANTRAAYYRAIQQFLAWAERAGYQDLEDIEPITVAAYIEILQRRAAPPTVNSTWLPSGCCFPGWPKKAYWPWIRPGKSKPRDFRGPKAKRRHLSKVKFKRFWARSTDLRTRASAIALCVKPPLDWLSNVSLILLIVLITVVNFDKVLQVFGTRGILAGLLFIALGFCIGWMLGGPGNDTRPVLALATAQRNIAAALVVGSQSFSDPKVVVMVIVVAIVGLIILMPLSRALANR